MRECFYNKKKKQYLPVWTQTPVGAPAADVQW